MFTSYDRKRYAQFGIQINEPTAVSVQYSKPKKKWDQLSPEEMLAYGSCSPEEASKTTQLLTDIKVTRDFISYRRG